MPPAVRRIAPRDRLIGSENDIRAGVRALRRRCEVMRRVHDMAGDPPLRRGAGGLEGLARIVIGQQVSIASAAAIWSRFQRVAIPFTAARLIELTDDELRSAGLSRPKLRTIRAISQAVAGGLALEALAARSDDEVREALTSVSGIGPWTADIYLMFCLGRADAFAAGDLALQVAAQKAFELDERPGPAQLAELAERWRPWRGVAARMLWTYYAAVKAAARDAQPV